MIHGGKNHMNPLDTKKIIDELKESQAERALVVADMEQKHPIKDFLTYNEFTLQERLEKLPMKLIEFQELLNRETAALDDLKDQLDIAKGAVYDHYRFVADKRLTSQEIKEFYIPGDPRLTTIKKQVKKQQWQVDYLSGCVKAIERMSWVVKDFIKTVGHGGF
jgi:hypothetical protein